MANSSFMTTAKSETETTQSESESKIPQEQLTSKSSLLPFDPKTQSVQYPSLTTRDSVFLLPNEQSLSLKQPETTSVQATQDSQDLQELLDQLEILEILEFSQVVLPTQLLPEPQLKFLNLTVESALSLIRFKSQPVSDQDLPQLVLLELLEPLDLLHLLMPTSPLSISQLEVIQMFPITLHFKSRETELKELQSTETPSQLTISNLESFSTDK